MILSEIIAILQTHRGELARRFAVRELAIFGSVARRVVILERSEGSA